VNLRHALIGAALALAALVVLGTTGYADDRVPGRPSAVLEDVPGQEKGPVCPLDERYADEQPKGLRPDVLDAWHRLRTEAERHGSELCLQDGKRSVGQQGREFADAVRRFGTEEQARKYVLPPEKSMHVEGVAVDVQPMAAAGWVEHNGRALGWCRRYENEYWHFEYDHDYADAGCPPLLPSATGA